MKRKMLFLVMFFISSFMFLDVNASGNVKLALSCPAAAKPNTTITCKVYGSMTGSEIDSVEQLYPIPSGALKKASYSIDYYNISSDSEKNIGTITIQTGNVGIGYVELVFDKIHFADGSVQNKSSITKKIVVNSTGTITSHNTVVSGDATNNNSNNNQTNTNADTYLKDIKLSRGILTPSFSKNVFKYSVNVDSDVSEISIDGIKNDVNQVIDGEVANQTLNYGKNTFKLIVTNGTSPKRIYEVVITRKDNRDTNAFLSSLSLSSGTVNFSKYVYDYEIRVLYDVTKLSVLATPEKSTSTVKVEGENNLKVGENIVTITVKSEKGNQQKYKIKVNRLKEGEQIGDNANIKDITILGYNLGFDYSKQEYKLLIKKEDKLDISVVMDDSNASYQIIGNDNLKDGSIIKIITKSFDQTASQTYSIEITKPNYTTYYVIAGLLVLLTITIPILFYFKYVKPKKQLVDINGNRIDKEDVFDSQYRKKLSTSVPAGVLKNNNQDIISNDAMINQSVSNSNLRQSQYAVNIGELNNQNNAFNNDMNSGKCPKCGRELLGSPSICPYCNTRLK